MAKRAARKKGERQLPLSPADQADAAALEAAVSMMIGVLEAWDYSRPLSSLNRADLHKLAVAAVGGFVNERTQHREVAWWSDLISDAPSAEPTSGHTLGSARQTGTEGIEPPAAASP